MVRRVERKGGDICILFVNFFENIFLFISLSLEILEGLSLENLSLYVINKFSKSLCPAFIFDDPHQNLRQQLFSCFAHFFCIEFIRFQLILC